MANLIVGFDEFGGVSEFNGMPINKSEPLIVNKAADYISLIWENIDDVVNYKLTFADYGKRCVIFSIKGE